MDEGLTRSPPGRPASSTTELSDPPALSPSQTRGGSAPGWAILAGGYAALGLAYLVWVWSHEVSDLGGDSAMYMLLARHFSPFYADSQALSAAVQGSLYPPLFPLLIGLVGGGMLAAHLLVAFAALIAVACLYFWLRQEGVGMAPSAWSAGLFALLPGTYFLTLNIWTENPYLLFSLVAILSESRASKSADSGSRLLWIAASAVAAATLTRTAALPLLGAFALRLFVTRPPRWPWFIALSATPFMIWAAWGMGHRSGVSGYLAQWGDAYSGNPLDTLAQQINSESVLLWASWIRSFVGQDIVRTPILYLLTVLGCVCLLGWWRRLPSLRLDALYVPAYATLLLLWPFPAEAGRLSYVLIPVLLAQGVLLAGESASRYRALRVWHGQLLLLSLFTITALPTLLVTVQRFAQPLPQPLAAARRTQEYYRDNRAVALLDAEQFTGTLSALRDIARVVQPGDCVFSTKPPLVSLYAGRISIAPPPPSSADAAFERDIDQCKYAFLSAATSPTYSEPLYPRDRVGKRGHPIYVVTNNAGFLIAALIEIEKQ